MLFTFKIEWRKRPYKIDKTLKANGELRFKAHHVLVYVAINNLEAVDCRRSQIITADNKTEIAVKSAQLATLANSPHMQELHKAFWSSLNHAVDTLIITPDQWVELRDLFSGVAAIQVPVRESDDELKAKILEVRGLKNERK